MIRSTRLFALIGIWAAAGACDPMVRAGIALAPASPGQLDSATSEALRVVSNIATVHELHTVPLRGEAKAEWMVCYGKAGVNLCAQQTNGELQFLLSESGFSFSEFAEILRDDLVSQLRGALGEDAVRACKWTYIGGSQVYGCAPAMNTSNDSPHEPSLPI